MFDASTSTSGETMVCGEECDVRCNVTTRMTGQGWANGFEAHQSAQQQTGSHTLSMHARVRGNSPLTSHSCAACEARDNERRQDDVCRNDDSLDVPVRACAH